MRSKWMRVWVRTADLTGNTTHAAGVPALRAAKGPREQTNGPGIGADRAGAVRLPPAWRRVALERALTGRQALHRSARRRIDAAEAAVMAVHRPAALADTTPAIHA
jgi:hypothetical protein